MATINYSLTPVSSEFTGGAKVFRANVQTNGTVNPDELIQRLAKRTRQDESLAGYFLNALNEEIRTQMLAGYRINLGQLATGFSIRGAFMNADDRFDPKRHALQPTIHALDPLRTALAEVSVENIQVGLTCSVYALMDAVTKELAAVTGTNTMHLQGVNLGIDTTNEDEYVRFVADDGSVAATAVVDSSDAQTITCHLAAPIDPGLYTVEIAARNGNRASLAPATAKVKNVLFKAA